MHNPTLRQVKEAVRNPVVFPGGYSLRFYCPDGHAICRTCIREEWRNIVESTIGHDFGWRIGAIDVHWEGPDDYCTHCSVALPSEYGDPSPRECIMSRVTYVVTYDESTAESSEDGESDRGFVVDGWDVSAMEAPTGGAFVAWCAEQGIVDVPLESDDDTDTIGAVVSFLRSEGYNEPNQAGWRAAPDAWTKDDGDGWSLDSRRLTVHFRGLTLAQRRLIYARMARR